MKKYLHFIVSSLLTAILLSVVVREGGFMRVFDIILGIEMWGFAAYVGLSLLGVAARAERYRVFLSAGGEASCVTRYQALILTAIRNAFVDFLPMRLGEGVYFYALYRFGVSMVTATAVFGGCLLLDIAVLLVLACLLAAGSAFYVDGSLSFALLFAGAAAAIALGFVVVVRCSASVAEQVRRLRQLETRIGGGVGAKGFVLLERLSDECAALAGQASLPRLIALTVVLRVAKYGSLYVLVRALLAPLGQAEVVTPFIMFAFIAAEATASLPVSGLMGFGAYEGGWVASAAALGMHISDPATVAFSVHLTTQLVGYLVGFLGLLGFFFAESKKRGMSSKISSESEVLG